MESLLIHPENSEQLQAIKAVLKALKIQFETSKDASLPQEIKEMAAKSIRSYEDKGEAMSLNEFSERYFIKK
ncbi:DUF2683 family protein [Pedobacter helvus]|uniref:DUF2683 family protein n=1 Tax=Pedobacter helvus TaxID=2563444 RepID=A0ABW9JN77_9SPHI|nr:DUF2683 family protein [Pedobacter ureilyticus]